MLSAAGKRFEDDKKSVVAAVIKQLIHIATDLYTPCGITLPGAGLVLSNSSVEQLTEYIIQMLDANAEFQNELCRIVAQLSKKYI